MQFSLYAGLLLLSSLISVALAGYASHRPSDKVMRAFLYLMIGVFCWSCTSFFEAISTSIGYKLFWSVVSVIDLVVPVLFLYFVLQFTRNGDRIPKKAVYLLLIIPVISFILSATFPIHGLIWPKISLSILFWPGSLSFMFMGPGTGWRSSIVSCCILPLPVCCFMR